jgi:UDP-N-acetyl-D-glucosamine dehydrogenase
VRANGGVVSYSDPHVPVFPKMREHKFDLSSVELSPQQLKEYDAVVLTTDHSKFDYDMIYEYSRLIIDSRGIYRKSASHIVKA